MAVLVGGEDIEKTKKKSYFTHFWKVESVELMLQEDEHPEKKKKKIKLGDQEVIRDVQERIS